MSDTAREALAELVALKDLKDHIEKLQALCDTTGAVGYAKRQYEKAKPIAWANARAVLAQPVGAGVPEDDATLIDRVSIIAGIKPGPGAWKILSPEQLLRAIRMAGAKLTWDHASETRLRDNRISCQRHQLRDLQSRLDALNAAPPAPKAEAAEGAMPASIWLNDMGTSQKLSFAPIAGAHEHHEYRAAPQAPEQAAAPVGRAPGHWIVGDPPNDKGSYLVANDLGQVAPYIRGVIHNNTGSPWDWNYGEAITKWSYLPSAAPQPPQQDKQGEPLSDEQIEAGLDKRGITTWGERGEDFEAGVRYAEAAHGIATQPIKEKP